MYVEKEGILTGKIIGCAMEVHRQLGPGLLESVYEECLCHELKLASLEFERQWPLAINYKGVLVGNKLKIDLLVNNEVIVELKSVSKLESIHEAQLLTYLRIANKKWGLLINFNVPLLKQGIKRMAN